MDVSQNNIVQLVLMDLFESVFDLLVFIRARRIESNHVHVIGVKHPSFLVSAVYCGRVRFHDCANFGHRNLFKEREYMEIVFDFFEPILKRFDGFRTFLEGF